MLKKKRISGIIIVLLVFVFSFIACKKYAYNAFIFTPEVGIHLLKGNVHLSDLVKIKKDSTLSFYEDENQLMHLVFESEFGHHHCLRFF